MLDQHREQFRNFSIQNLRRKRREICCPSCQLLRGITKQEKVMEALLEKEGNCGLWATGYSSKIPVLSSNAPVQSMHVSLHTMIADGRTDFFDHCLCGLMAKAHPS